MIIESSRLIIKALSLKELQEFINNNVLVNTTYNTSNFEMSTTQKRAINTKIEKMKNAKVENHDWYTYWIIINKNDLKVMGLIGFKGLNEDGKAEVGYGISRKYEGNGFMTEAAKTLISWAFEGGRCRAITAGKVLISNIGSQKILLKCGFKKIGENDETIDYILEKKI